MTARDHDEARALAARYRDTGDRSARNRLVELHLDIADFFARKYARPKASVEDLRQVGLLAMVRAVDRFDPDRGIAFSTFASRTVEGELKRYLRDHSHSVRAPRAVQELNLAVRSAQEPLTQKLGRVPTVAELADHLATDVDHVLEALEAGARTWAVSLDQPDRNEDGATIADHALGAIEEGYGATEVAEVLRTLLATLPERDRLILRMRFFEERGQEEIAAQLGISQSYLSRVLRKLLDDLRARLDDGDAALIDHA